MKAQELPRNERKLLQYATIIGILLMVYLFFVRQRIVTAMIVGVALVIAQRAYLKLRGRRTARS